MSAPYFLGIDAGGSHCRSRLIDATGRVIGSGATGPANARVGLDQLHATLMVAANEAIHTAGLSADQVATIAAGFGVAGITRVGVREALTAAAFPFASLAVDSDAVIANIGAHDGGDGATLIIGTGSVAQIRVEGRNFAIGGYGFPISDEGSGAALGLSAMRHALRALDGRTRPTPLSSAITARFGHDTAQAVAWMDAATPRDYGALAPIVMDHAEANDEIARAIVEEGARHIERFIDAVFQRGAPACALAGGLAPRMQPWLKARTVARLSAPIGDALDGALRLAGYRRPA